MTGFKCTTKYTKNEYESLIENSPLFTINKEMDPSLYESEKYIFVDLYLEYFDCFCMGTVEMEKYSMTFVEVINSCIKSYKKENGSFIHYFNTAFYKKYRTDLAKEKMSEKRMGLVISKKDSDNIRAIIQHAKSINADITQESKQAQIAQYLGLDIDTVKDLIELNYNLNVVNSTIKDEDDNEIELYDLIPSSQRSLHDLVFDPNNTSSAINFIDKIEDAFNGLQNRPITNSIISILLTTKLVKEFECDYLEELIKNRSFINQQVVDNYYANGYLPSEKDVANMFDITLPSVSRTWKNFLNKI